MNLFCFHRSEQTCFRSPPAGCRRFYELRPRLPSCIWSPDRGSGIKKILHVLLCFSYVPYCIIMYLEKVQWSGLHDLTAWKHAASSLAVFSFSAGLRHQWCDGAAFNGQFIKLKTLSWLSVDCCVCVRACVYSFCVPLAAEQWWSLCVLHWAFSQCDRDTWVWAEKRKKTHTRQRGIQNTSLQGNLVRIPNFPVHHTRFAGEEAFFKVSNRTTLSVSKFSTTNALHSSLSPPHISSSTRYAFFCSPGSLVWTHAATGREMNSHCYKENNWIINKYDLNTQLYLQIRSNQPKGFSHGGLVHKRSQGNNQVHHRQPAGKKERRKKVRRRSFRLYTVIYTLLITRLNSQFYHLITLFNLHKLTVQTFYCLTNLMEIC